MPMDKYLRRPENRALVSDGRYQRYNLKENPFPSSPFINPQSTDSRSNGDIYEWDIRQNEYNLINKNFFGVPQSDQNHLRLGYIIDTSYVGRGNGKSAFLVNLQKRINADFSFAESKGQNKCFAITVVPEPGGKTKTFEKFIDIFVQGIFESTIIDDCLAGLRLEAIIKSQSEFDIDHHFTDEEAFREKLTSERWFTQQKIDTRQISEYIKSNSFLQSLPSDFPIYSQGLFSSYLPSKDDFVEYYKGLKRGRPKFDFVFSDLVSLFLAAGFNGAYIFVDDFERIPDFQSERQKRDFALELRTCLFDGMYLNSRTGFYVALLVLHAGVPRLIQDAWDQSGLEQRAPISFSGNPRHIVQFEKITSNDAYSLIRKYLQSYRIQSSDENDYYPFTEDAVRKIAELSEFNASKILKKAYEVLEQAVDEQLEKIDEDFISSPDEGILFEDQKGSSGIHNALTKNLMQESE